MLSVLTRNLDQSRVLEFIDFFIVFMLLLLASLICLAIVFLPRMTRLKRALKRTSEEIYYYLLPILSLDSKDRGLIKQLANYLPYPKQRHRL